MKHFTDSQGILWAYEEDGSQDHLIGDKVLVTQEKIDEINVEKSKQYLQSLSYGVKRKLEYPSIGDQLDALFHAGTFPADMAAQIQAVKNKYPKS
jgi:hypothetical protein